jgi:hypothetical protein
MSSLTTVTQVPSYPGSKPITAQPHGLYNKFNIYSDLSTAWEGHTALTFQFDQHIMRFLAGLSGYQDALAVNDHYRTNRYDLASHWIRAFNSAQPVPSGPAGIKTAVGKRFVALMDQHITLSGIVAVQELRKADLITEQKAMETFKGLLNILPSSATFQDFMKLNAVGDLVANGKQILGLFATIYDAKVHGGDLSKASSDQKFNQHAFDKYNEALAKDAFFKAHAKGNEAFLKAAGLPTLNPAQNVWNAHLVQVAVLVGKEIAYIKAVKNGGDSATVTKASQETTKAAEDLLYHAPAGWSAVDHGGRLPHPEVRHRLPERRQAQHCWSLISSYRKKKVLRRRLCQG